MSEGLLMTNIADCLIMMLLRFLSLILWACLHYYSQAAELDEEPHYTEDLEEFKGKAFGVRIEKLLACWLYIRELHGTDELFEMQVGNLPVLKRCMQKINRKEAITKITSLASGNLQPVKKFEEILTEEQLLWPEETAEISPLDEFLLEKSKYFEKQLQEMNSKGAIKNQVEEELKKRQHFFFGLIPAGATAHSIILVTISVFMMCCCTWCKFWRASSSPRKPKKMQQLYPEARPYSQLMKTTLKNSSITRSIKSKKI